MKKQMKLSTFCMEFDMPKSTAIQLIHSKGFPGYKLGKCWYVDIEKFYEWREIEHAKSYRWA